MIPDGERAKAIRAYRSGLDAVIDRVTAETTISRLLNPDAPQGSRAGGRLLAFFDAVWVRVRQQERGTQHPSPARRPDVSSPSSPPCPDTHIECGDGRYRRCRAG